MTHAEQRLADLIAAEAIRLLSQPNSLQMPEDVRIDMAICMACDKYRQEFSEDVLETIQKTKGEYT
jgi:hypothetical protein